MARQRANIRMDLEEKTRRKRDSNRKSASSSRARKKALIEEMTKENAEMKKRARVMALLPDMILALRLDGKITYITERCEHFLQYRTGELCNTSFYPNLTAACQVQLRMLLEECLGEEGKERVMQAVKGITSGEQDASNDSSSSLGSSMLHNASTRSTGTSNSSFHTSDSDSGQSSQTSGNKVRGVDMSAVAAPAEAAAGVGGVEAGEPGGVAVSAGSRSTGSGDDRSCKTSEDMQSSPVESFCGADEYGSSSSFRSGGSNIDSELRRKISMYNACSHQDICKLCVIRRDQSTVWCKVRSSVRYIAGEPDKGGTKNIIPAELVLTFRILQEGASARPQEWPAQKRRKVSANRESSSSGTDSGSGSISGNGSAGSKKSCSAGSGVSGVSLISQEVSGSSNKGGTEDNDDDEEEGSEGTVNAIARARAGEELPAQAAGAAGAAAGFEGKGKGRRKGSSSSSSPSISPCEMDCTGAEDVQEAVQSLMMISETDKGSRGKQVKLGAPRASKGSAAEELPVEKLEDASLLPTPTHAAGKKGRFLYRSLGF